MKRILLFLYTILLAFGLLSNVQAVPLQNLFDGQNIIVNDKLFFDWNLDFVLSTDPMFDPDFSLIEVIPLDEQLLNPGLRFESNNQLTVTDANFLDVTFSFDVVTLDPKLFIIDNSLGITEATIQTVNGDPLIAIVEDVYDATGNLLASNLVEFDSEVADLLDSAVFAPQQFISVEKNILIAGLAPGDSAELIVFEQRFSQVPEPTTMLLLGTGLAGLAGFRKKFKK